MSWLAVLKSSILSFAVLFLKLSNSAKSLRFLSLDGLYVALGYLKRDNKKPQLTDHYFTGDYPIKLIDQLGDNKITQLSLLSSGSNI